jgi:hypothetical protein
MKKIFSIIGSIIIFIFVLGFSIFANDPVDWIIFAMMVILLPLYISSIFINNEKMEMVVLSILTGIVVHNICIGIFSNVAILNFFASGLVFFNSIIIGAFVVLYFMENKSSFISKIGYFLMVMPFAFSLNILYYSSWDNIAAGIIFGVFALLLGLSAIFARIGIAKIDGPHVYLGIVSLALSILGNIIFLGIEGQSYLLPLGFTEIILIILSIVGLAYLSYIGKKIEKNKEISTSSNEKYEDAYKMSTNVEAMEVKREDIKTQDESNTFTNPIKEERKEDSIKEDSISPKVDANLDKKTYESIDSVPLNTIPSIDEIKIEEPVIEEKEIENTKDLKDEDYLIKTPHVDLSSSLDDFLYHKDSDDSFGNISNYDPMDSLKGLGEDKK